MPIFHSFDHSIGSPAAGWGKSKVY